MGEAKRRKEALGDEYGKEQRIYPWLPLTKKQAEDAYNLTTRGAWVGIGLMAVIGFALGRLCTKLLQILYPISCLHWFPSALSILFAALYSCLAGFSLPTQRALIMVVVYHLFLISYRKANPWLLFVVSLLIGILARVPIFGGLFGILAGLAGLVGLILILLAMLDYY